MEYQKYRKYFYFLILGLITIASYILLSNQNTLVLKSFNIPFRIPYISVDLFSKNVSIINGIKMNFEFESRIYDYYPHLPIHIFTQDLSLIGNKSKLILLGNGFFRDRYWGFAKPNRSSKEISMNE